MTTGKRIIDRSIGETREAMIVDGRVMGLYLSRWSAEGRRAQWGERYLGRVRAIDRRLRGGFVDLGLSDEEGFLRCDGAGRVHVGEHTHALVEGESIHVDVRREGARGKGPVVAMIAKGETGVSPHRLQTVSPAEGAAMADIEMRDLIDAAIDEASARAVAIPGGGRLTIEPVAALTAIDVDASARAGGADPEKFALELNLAAGTESVRQIRLRGLGGVIVIDFVSMRARQNQIALVKHMRAAFSGDPWGVIVAPLSRFGLLELSRTQMRRPLHETLLDANGAATTETEALALFRAMEREARGARGRVVTAGVPPHLKAWLEREHIAWRAALNDRIGTRWDIVERPLAARKWEVTLV